ncbi:MAG: hypothetical protein Q9198_006306 [Flavoplaca austrocitrina]
MHLDRSGAQQGCGEADDPERLLAIIRECERCSRRLMSGTTKPKESYQVAATTVIATRPQNPVETPPCRSHFPASNPGSILQKRKHSELAGLDLSPRGRVDPSFSQNAVLDKKISGALVRPTPAASEWWNRLCHCLGAGYQQRAGEILSIDKARASEQLLDLASRIRQEKVHSNFDDLVLSSVCEVVNRERSGLLSFRDLNMILGKDVKNGHVDDKLARSARTSITGARRANDIVNQLYHANWGVRSLDLPMIWDQPLSFYSKVNTAQSQLVVEAISKPEYTCGLPPRPEDMPDYATLPELIHMHVGSFIRYEFFTTIDIRANAANGASYETVCRRLMYSDGFIRETGPRHDIAVNGARFCPSTGATRDDNRDSVNSHMQPIAIRQQEKLAEGAYTQGKSGPKCGSFIS